MKYKCLICILFFIEFSTAYSQIISGYIVDAVSGERLASANIIDIKSKKGVSSDANGYYSFVINHETILVVSMVGYKSDTLSQPELTSFHGDIVLKPSTARLAQVEILSEQTGQNFIQGKIYLPVEKLRTIPTIGGEKDILKVITAMPGVNGGAEGFSTISVRGGGTDQNLFLIDGVPMYNTGHLFNFISIFNAEAIKSISLYKNNFPARYGGSLASVTEINLRDGNKFKPEIKADIGLINSKLTCEGPLGKTNKTSYILALRSTYLDLFRIGRYKKIVDFVPDIKNEDKSFTGYTFADASFKLSHSFNKSNSVYLSLFNSFDLYRSCQSWKLDFDETMLKRYNGLVSLKSLHIINPRTFYESLLTFSYHNNQLTTDNELFRYDVIETDTILHKFVYNYSWLSKAKNYEFNSMRDVAFSNHLTYTINKKSILMLGIGYINHTYYPVDYNNYSLDTSGIETTFVKSDEKLRSHELSAYINHELLIGKTVNINTGMRFSGLNFGKALFFNAEPRVSIGYRTTKAGVFSWSLTKMVQYNHALMRNEQLMQTLVWVPSTSDISPEKAWQYSIGHLKMTNNNKFELQTNLYFKRMTGLVYLNENYESKYIYNSWEQKLLSNGLGRGYGIELSLSKLSGNLTGNINYTYSNHERKFEQINQGHWFNYKYNRNHVMNISVSYKLSDKWRLGLFWTLSSGIYFNIPDGYVNDNPFGFGYYTYSGLNNRRLPPYHRLDLNAEWQKVYENNRNISISLNIYNVYNRQNPVYIYIEKVLVKDNYGNVTGEKFQAKTKSYMPVIPSINVSYKFM